MSFHGRVYPQDMVHANYTKRDIAGMTAQEQLDAIDGKRMSWSKSVPDLQLDALPLLKQHGLRVVTEHEAYEGRSGVR